MRRPLSNQRIVSRGILIVVIERSHNKINKLNLAFFLGCFLTFFAPLQRRLLVLLVKKMPHIAREREREIRTHESEGAHQVFNA